MPNLQRITIQLDLYNPRTRIRSGCSTESGQRSRWDIDYRPVRGPREFTPAEFQSVFSELPLIKYS